MNKYIIRVILIYLTLIVSQGLAQDNWEYRSNYEIIFSTTEDIDFKIKPKFWFNGMINDIYSSDVEIGVDKKLNKWLSVSPYYRHIVLFKENDKLTEYRPQVDVTVNQKVRDISFQSRNRLEYRIRESNNSFRYRNKLTIKLPDIFDKGFRLSLSEEPFFDCKKREIDKNRVYANFSFPLKNNFTIDLFYILEHAKKDDNWNYVNVFGTTLKYRI